MKTLFKKENLKNTILTLVNLIFGVSLCVAPVRMYNFVEAAFCFVLLAIGVIFVLIYSLMSSDDKSLKHLVYGAIGLLLGFLMIMVPQSFGVLLSLIVGYSGVSMIISGVKIKKAGQKTWITDFVIGVVVTALSVATIVLSLINSGVVRIILAIFFGVILLTNGIYSLVNIIKMLKKERQEKKKQIAENAVSGEETTEIVEEEPAEEIKEEVATQTVSEQASSEVIVDDAMQKINSAKRKIIKKKNSK